MPIEDKKFFTGSLVKKLFWLLVASVLVLPQKTAAQGWGPLSPQLGTGTGICDTSTQGHLCLAIKCAPQDYRLMLAIYSNRPGRPAKQDAVVVVDQQKPKVTGLVQGSQAGEWHFNSLIWSRLLIEMVQGQAITVYDHSPFSFSLRGARPEIERTLAACHAIDKSSHATVAELLDSQDNEPVSSSDFLGVRYFKQAKILGTAIASGTSDPSLRGIGAEACVAACVARGDCDFATYTGGQNICTLQAGLGAIVPDQTSFTTMITERPVDPPRSAFSGPPPTEQTGLRWKPGEEWQGYVARLRAASAPLGNDCQLEANVMRQFMESLKVTPPALNATVGQPVSLSWTSQSMSQRIPSWMVLSVERPARFDGDGFYGLNAGAIGPFGVQTDASLQRAFAPLYTEGTTDKGEIQVLPLEAGKYRLRATLLSYLRACQQELPLAQMEWTIEVAPAAPQIVLRDITSKHPYDRRALVPEFNRRIEISDTRFIIQNLTDGSEVLAREGKDLRLSPTKRFVVVKTAGRFRMYDIVDGGLVVNIPDSGSFVFWNADSFFLTDTSPWAQTTIGATMRPRVFMERFQTGPSCCNNDGRTAHGIDLENNFVRTQGQRNVTWSTDPVTSLLTSESLGTFEQKALVDTGRSSLGGGRAISARTSIDFVSPLKQEQAWDMPLGPFHIYGHSTPQRDKDQNKQNEQNVIGAMATDKPDSIPNPDFGKSARVIAQTQPEMTVLRGLPETDTQDRRKGFAAALERSGVSLLDSIEPLQWIKWDNYFAGSAHKTYASDPNILRVVNQIVADASAVGKSVSWSLYNAEEVANVSYCEYFPESVAKLSSLNEAVKAPLNFASALRFDLGNRAVWVNMTRCSGGATGGTLVDATALHIFDTASPVPSYGQSHVKNRFTLGSEISVKPFERITDAKLFNQNLLVAYAKGAGTLMVYDLSQRKFLLEIEYGRRGDLLDDVFIDASGQHLFQLNTDGSFTVYRIADQAAILEGRYLDDELVVWTADFHFDATEEGAAFVELRFPGQAGQYSFQQFDQALRLPGLLQTVLNGGELPVRPVVGVPPKIQGRIGAGPTGDVEGVVSFTSDAKVKTLRVFQDGVQTHTIPDLDRPLISFKLPRQDGARWVSLIAEDETGLVSLPLSGDMGPTASRLTRTHYLGIGVDYYKDNRLQSLNYAKLDSVKMADSFGALHGKTIDVVSDIVLTDRRASKDAIVQNLDRIMANSKVGDHVVLFFAGHGLQDAKGRFYLGLSSTNLDNLEETALDWELVSDTFAQKGIRVTVLLDACHAGAAGTDAFATNDEAVESLLDTSINNVTILAAAKGRQFSGESARVGGGFFTEAMRQVLLDGRSQFDENNNGVLEAVEFYRGVKTIVVNERGSEQTPWLVRNPLVGEYGLF